MIHPARSGHLAPGDRVRLTGRFLVFTAQRSGAEGAKVWTVRECACSLCAAGAHVSVDEPSTYGGYTAEEIAAEPGLAWRHVARANLARGGVPDPRNEAPLVGKLPLGHKYDGRK